MVSPLGPIVVTVVGTKVVVVVDSEVVVVPSGFPELSVLLLGADCWSSPLLNKARTGAAMVLPTLLDWPAKAMPPPMSTTAMATVIPAVARPRHCWDTRRASAHHFRMLSTAYHSALLRVGVHNMAKFLR